MIKGSSMNIEDYDFGDQVYTVEKSQNVILFKIFEHELFIGKSGAIALAKHFKLTADDLKALD